jgi:hypothetical protein
MTVPFFRHALKKTQATDTTRRASATATQACQRSLRAVTLGASTVAAIAIVAGLPGTGIAIYLAATLPLALFS